MRICRYINAGQDGTKRLTKQYGDRLVRVRYRYDEHTQKRYKTVELVVEEWECENIISEVSCIQETGQDTMSWFRFRGYLPKLYRNSDFIT